MLNKEIYLALVLFIFLSVSSRAQVIPKNSKVIYPDSTLLKIKEESFLQPVKVEIYQRFEIDSVTHELRHKQQVLEKKFEILKSLEGYSEKQDSIIQVQDSIYKSSMEDYRKKFRKEVTKHVEDYNQLWDKYDKSQQRLKIYRSVTFTLGGVGLIFLTATIL